MYFIATTSENEKYGISNYQTRLNILKDLPIYFSDLKNIHNFYYDKMWIRPVVVPSNAKTKIINYTVQYWDTDKIVMCDRFPLYSLKTIKKFNLKITDFYISEVCRRDKIDILEWWKNSGYSLEYDASALYYASGSGQVEVLEWWKNSGLELKYDKYVLNYASSNGQVEVLEWWKNSGLELKYDNYALYWASRNGKVEVLEWWKNSGLELKYTEWVLQYAFECGQVNVLEWWKNSGLELKYISCMLDRVPVSCRDDVLEWLKNSGLIK